MTEVIFCNCRIYLLPNGLLKKRIKLFQDQISRYGGEVVFDAEDPSITHIIIEDTFLLNPMQVKNALKSMKISPKNIQCEIVSTLWLSKCLKEKSLLKTDEFLFKETSIFNEPIENKCQTPNKIRKVDVLYNVIAEKGNSDGSIQQENDMNKIIIHEFQKLSDAYRARGDKWRQLAYDKAISSLKSYPKRISNINELKSLPNISAKMYDKISEIMEDGFLSKVQDVCDERTKTLEIFGKVWGAGPVTAQLWYQKGLRKLEDLDSKGNLTVQQKIGLKYYSEIQESIPREEVIEIIDVIKKTVIEIEPSLCVMPCGSYRRGKRMCGDIDVLLIVKDSINYRSLLSKIIYHLKLDGFLIEDLVGTANSSACSKYLGICKLKGEKSKIRRLDIFAVPERESACAIMHYTGSAIFNRGIRLHASKMNMHLSENALINVPQGKILPTRTEEDIFEHLGLQFKPPEDREIF